MRVLLVAPRTDLLMVDAEVQSIVNSGIVARSRLGKVEHDDVVSELRSGNYDILWLCTHGNDQGVQLSDGILSSSLLTSLVRGKFDAVILNTCSSVQTAIMLQNETDAEVIATVVNVPDKEAFQTGALLAEHLATTGNLETAYNASKPGSNRTYLRLAGSKKK